MAIISWISSGTEKCYYCRFYEYEDNDWLSGTCVNEDSKAFKNRYYNSKPCVQFRLHMKRKGETWMKD